MAEYFGAAAASIALLTTLTQCGLDIHKAVKRIKSSRSDISELADEVVSFAGLCEDFSRLRMEKPRALPSGTFTFNSLEIWIEKTLKGLTKLLKTVEALRTDSESFSLEAKLIAYLEWFFSKSSVKRLRASMSIARQSVGGFSNLIYITKLNEELRMLRHALERPSERRKLEQELGITLEKKIDMLQQAVEIKHAVHVTSARQLRAATDDIAQQKLSRSPIDLVPAPTELFRFTVSLEIFAKEVVPPRRVRRRTNSSRSSDRMDSAPAPQESTSRRSPKPPRTIDNSRTAESSSNNSTSSIRTPVMEDSSVTSASIEHDRTSESGPSHCVAGRPNHHNNMPTERTKELINDTEGTILSPPKVKNASTTRERSTRIGRHNIALTATGVTLNDYLLPAESQEHGLKFYQAVVGHPELLDSLDEAVRQGSEDWDGIPNWVVNPSEVRTQAA